MNRYGPSVMIAVTVISMLAYPVHKAEGVERPEVKKWILDDFNDGDSISALGTPWQAFTDRVMGGQSDIEARIERDEGNNFIRMSGDVSLKNNGGFIQVRLPLSNGGRALDASEFSGFYISLRGSRGPYFLHIRTPDNRAPWSYYSAEIQVSENWTTFTILWSDFEPVSTSRLSPDTGKLLSLGVVAAENEFQPELDISELGLYRNMDER